LFSDDINGANLNGVEKILFALKSKPNGQHSCFPSFHCHSSWSIFKVSLTQMEWLHCFYDREQQVAQSI